MFLYRMILVNVLLLTVFHEIFRIKFPIIAEILFPSNIRMVLVVFILTTSNIL